MLLDEREKTQYRAEIHDWCVQELGEEPSTGLIWFGIFEKSQSGPVLAAFAAVKNYMGNWYLRECVVLPDFRGKGYQRKLIKERLEYIAERAKVARVSVYPDNQRSIRNIEEVGFVFERFKKLKDGEVVKIYRRELTLAKDCS